MIPHFVTAPSHQLGLLQFYLVIPSHQIQGLGFLQFYLVIPISPNHHLLSIVQHIHRKYTRCYENFHVHSSQLIPNSLWKYCNEEKAIIFSALQWLGLVVHFLQSFIKFLNRFAITDCFFTNSEYSLLSMNVSFPIYFGSVITTAFVKSSPELPERGEFLKIQQCL